MSIDGWEIISVMIMTNLDYNNNAFLLRGRPFFVKNWPSHLILSITQLGNSLINHILQIKSIGSVAHIAVTSK